MNKKKILLSAALILAAGVISFAASKKDKRKILHNGKFIYVSDQAAAIHMAHGDLDYTQHGPAGGPEDF